MLFPWSKQAWEPGLSLGSNADYYLKFYCSWIPGFFSPGTVWRGQRAPVCHHTTAPSPTQVHSLRWHKLGRSLLCFPGADTSLPTTSPLPWSHMVSKQPKTCPLQPPKQVVQQPSTGDKWHSVNAACVAGTSHAQEQATHTRRFIETFTRTS